MTIFLSVVLLGVAITELLCAWSIIQELALQPEWKFVLYYTISEIIPSLAMVCFLHKSSDEKEFEVLDKADDEVEMSLHDRSWSKN